MTGNFNVDFSQLHSYTNQLHDALLSIMSMFGITQLINTSTIFTSTTSTIFDVILISDPAKISRRGVLDLDLNDCQIIYYIRKYR